LGQGEVKWAGPAELPRGREGPDGGVRCQWLVAVAETVCDHSRGIRRGSDG
jgi:hypothetical protein